MPGSRFALLKPATCMIRKKMLPNSKIHGIPQDAVPAPKRGLLVILTLVMEDGVSMVSPILMLRELNGTGGAHACWVEEPITGEGSRCVLGHVISKEKALMASAMIGRSAMKM